MKECIIKLEDVDVSYLQSRKGIFSVKDFLLKATFSKPFVKYKVLNGINLEIFSGESIGVFGANGCGKSTLLRAIAGIIKPEKGVLTVKVPVSPLLALGAGIELELTGYENIKIALALSGNYNRKTNKESIDKIAHFAELSNEQLRMPTKMYSSGMLARLSFSCVITNQPEILLIDEVLAVGDKGFQIKCKDRIREIIETGATLLFVSHNPNEVREICKRGICIQDGKITFDGDSNKAADIYDNMF